MPILDKALSNMELNEKPEYENDFVPSLDDDYQTLYEPEDELEELDFDTIVAKLESGFRRGDEDHDFE
jgi:hypothetical protein